jgi:hypothetical protein
MNYLQAGVFNHLDWLDDQNDESIDKCILKKTTVIGVFDIWEWVMDFLGRVIENQVWLLAIRIG